MAEIRFTKQKEKKLGLFEEFNDCINDLINTDLFKKLDEFCHHRKGTRLHHSVNVSYYSYFIAKKFGMDYKSAARGALLHDLFFFNRKDNFINEYFSEKYATGNKRYSYIHPRAALENAEKICILNKIEKDIILKHMFLATLDCPRYKESFLVTFVDKICAIFEPFGIRKKFAFIH